MFFLAKKSKNRRFVNKGENLRLFRENNLEKFWWFGKKSYLCIRFRSETGVSDTRESSLKDLHRQIEVVQEASAACCI